MTDIEQKKRLEQRRRRDPLVRKEKRSSTVLRVFWVLLATIVFHGGLALLVANIPEPAHDEDDDEPVEVAIVETPPPKEEPPPPPPPEPEEPSQPEEPPKPEPEEPPEPEPQPEPKQQQPEPRESQDPPEPKEQPPEPDEPPESTEPPPDEARQEQAASEAESMDALEVQGLDMNSTVEGGDGPTMKVGRDLNRGKITDNYVDPDRMDEIETGEGDGEGKGSSDTPGTAAKPRNCPEKEAQPVKRHQVPPDRYPLAARRRGIQGTVVALVTVDSEGRVSSVEILEGVGHGLDELAADAFRKWRFKPARANCSAVSSKVRVRHEFRLSR